MAISQNHESQILGDSHYPGCKSVILKPAWVLTSKTPRLSTTARQKQGYLWGGGCPEWRQRAGAYAEGQASTTLTGFLRK